MKEAVYSAEQVVVMMCSVCDNEQNHIVQTVTKQGKITGAMCAACETMSKFSRGQKTSVTVGSGKAASPYDRTRRYRKGQALTHDVFGRGEVSAVIEPQKIDVLFGDRTRRLIHAQD
jgi:hypothetical protein